MGGALVALAIVYYAQDLIEALRDIAEALRERDE